MQSPIKEVIQSKPMVVPEGMPIELIRELMLANKIQQIPQVDADNRVMVLHTWDKFNTNKRNDSLIVIMAGGKGTRLRPHTKDCPKPMLLVRQKPILAHIIERAKAEGFRNFLLAIHYLGHVIEDYFGNGNMLGVNINYLREETPLGTAGALSLIENPPDKPFVVTNGDVITDIKYQDLLDFHNHQGADATMAVHQHEWKHPFGVVKTKGLKIVGFEEKPIVRSHINAGVYAISPDMLRHLTPNQACDMPSLFENLKAQNMLTLAYPMHEPWLDVGRPDDLIAANTRQAKENVERL